MRTIKGRDQHIWIGGDSGLVFSDGSRFQKITPSDSLTFGSVSGIEETSDGSLWLAESRGVIHISGDAVRGALNRPTNRVDYKVFDSFDGLPGTFQNPVRGGREVQTSDGRLWFIATNGVAWINPTKIVKNYLPPPVSIRSVEANGERYDPRGTLALQALTSRLQISYTALSLTVPGRIPLPIPVGRADKDWEDVGTRREAFYTMLPAGRYRFRVIASNNDGGEGRWTIKAAIDEGVPATVLTTALYKRFSSRRQADFSDRLLSAKRYEFGGHLEKAAVK